MIEQTRIGRDGSTGGPTGPAFSAAGVASAVDEGSGEWQGDGALDPGGGPGGQPGDPMVEAIDELEQAIAANVADERMLLGRLRALRAARRAGHPWRAILREEPKPTTLSLAGRLTNRLSSATRAMRHTLAVSLLREGATTSEVAGHFDVSRQRVSHLVRRRAAQSLE